jgi:NADH-quinone oxidoreductase subunit L
VAGALVVPGLTDVIHHFLEPTFEDSRFNDTAPTERAEWIGLGGGAVVGITGIAVAYHVYVRRVGLAGRVRERYAGIHRFLVNKWYFDELFDRLIVRPVGAAGDFGRRVIETDFVQGVIVGGATGVVRAGTALARSVQTGYMRAYALMLLTGLGGLVLYFLVTST